MTSIDELASRLVRSHNERAYRELRGPFLDALAKTRDLDTLDAIVAEERVVDLPFELACQTFERMLALDGGRRPGILRRYAQYLWLHGPDWDEFASMLEREADARRGLLDLSIASLVAQYPRFRWGDRATIADGVPEALRPGREAEIYGAISEEGEAEEWIYLVEYDDGAYARVPGVSLIPRGRRSGRGPTATYRLWRQVDGAGIFAEVCVCLGAVASDEPASPPESWLRAARAGALESHRELGDEAGRPPDICEVRGTHTDTTEDAMRAAGFLAVARLYGRSERFEVVRQGGALAVREAGASRLRGSEVDRALQPRADAGDHPGEGPPAESEE